MQAKKSELQFDCMIYQHLKTQHGRAVNEAFLRKPYQYTSAEPKDETQEKLHEYDYRK